jgi:hypothetical protein
MRITWMLGAVLGATAIAGASPNVQFQTVINENDPVGSDQFDAAGQVVVGANGTVGIVALLQSGNLAIIYSTPGSGGTWNNQAVAVGGQNYNIPSIPTTEDFDGFDNLAITGNPSGGTRLTFDASDFNNNNGILQWDVGTSSLQDVAFDGDTKGYSSVGYATDSGGSSLEVQVNGTGQAMFPAVQSSKNVIVRGDYTSLTTIFTSGASLSDTDQGSRVALGADGSGVALLSASGVPGIYNIPANGTTPTEISGSFTPSTFADPVIGYTSGNGLNAALMFVNGTGSRTQNVILEKNGGTPQSILSGQFTVPTSSDPEQGQMTPNGQIALFLPSTSGDTIQYANAASANPTASVIASVYSGSGPVPNTALALDPTGSNLDIEALQYLGNTWGPEVNSGGTVLFNAEVGTSPSNEVQALLDWQPGDQSPEILLKAGDQVDVDGNMVTIQDFTLNNLSNDYDYYKNALNDQNDIAVAVDYTGGPDGSGSAVLYAAIPEPSTISLLSIAGFGLLRRRSRR